jgi:hypothetical protein
MQTRIAAQTDDTGDIYFATRRSESALIRERTAALTADLGEPQLFWPPPERGWSIAQVFEHLALLNDSYLAPMRAAIEQAPPAGGAPWRPSFLGKLLLRAVAPETAGRGRTMKLWQPTRAVRRSVVQAFLGTQDEIDAMTRTSERLDLSRARLSSPANRLVRLNLGDAFVILNQHALRHLDQVERIRQHADFPRR